jgi:hypothetical protein
MVMLSMQDETAQKKGVCNVAYAPGNLLSLASSFAKVKHLIAKVGDVLVNLPMRITSYHFCYTDPRMQILLVTIRKFFGKEIRMRSRTHFGTYIYPRSSKSDLNPPPFRTNLCAGSDLEMQYSLTTFGIPCKFLLQNDARDGIDTKKQLHELYIHRRRVIEPEEENARVREELTSGVIFYPRPADVLIGRGRPYQEYPGNQRFGRLIDANLDLYHKCSDRFGKTCLSMDIAKTVQDYGGRFIERTKSGTWKVIDDVVAREKTAIGFRSRVSKVNMDGPSKPSRAYDRNVVENQAKKLRYDPSIATY